MGQINNGIFSILSHPFIYDAFQNIMGVRKLRSELNREFVRASLGDSVIDFGCGTAGILDSLPAVEYFGFDISNKYIQYAKSRFGDRAHFECKNITEKDSASLPKFDIALALGVLHHLDDEEANGLLRTAFALLKKGGRLITVDPCYTFSQNILASFLIKQDRGQNVRDQAGYGAIAKSVFQNNSITVKHLSWLPYKHCVMECIK